LLICVGAQAQGNPITVSDRLDKLVTERFSSTKCPGLSVAVSAKNQIVFSKAMGMADIEQGVSLNHRQHSPLGSLSKPITGTIIMDLVEQGKLSLDVSVRQYLPELPSTYQKVTLRHLLTHQSGVNAATPTRRYRVQCTHYPTSREVLKTFIGFSAGIRAGNQN